eukprot:COSAG02_NODE_577_length_20095_cov_6.816413_17_plen_159_part_00
MIQKVVLVALMGGKIHCPTAFCQIVFKQQVAIAFCIFAVIPPSRLQKVAQVAMSIVVACAVCHTMPSKTQEFNYANIVSQGTIILNFLAAVLLAESSSTVDVGVSPEQIETIVAVGMQVMMLYLVYVIFAKVKEMVEASSRGARFIDLALSQKIVIIP